MTLKEELVSKLQIIGIQPKRSLGQNFLIGEHVVSEIFKHFDRRNPPFVVEVGPGLGALTERLIERKTSRKLIELDSTFANYWLSRGESVLEKDALKVNWSELSLPAGTMLLSNLPYQIGGRLIVELSVGPLAITEMLIMLQKEVAVRLNAAPKTKDYSYLSVITQTFWSVNKVVDASGADFYPQPKVSSRVVSLSRKTIASQFNEDYLNFIKLAFQFRRKFMLKSFRDKDEVLRGALKELGYKETVRAEEISVLDFQKLYMAVKD